MGTLNTAMNIAAGALDADQNALNVVANNTSNTSTPGYTREVAQWQENDQVTINGVSYGTGVTMTGGTSQRDRVLEQRLQQQNQIESGSGARLTALSQVQSVFNQVTSANGGTGDGIGQNLSSFFNSLTALEATPADNSLRQGVLSAANSLSSSFNAASAQLAGQQQGLGQQSVTIVGQVNALTSSIAQLNQQISSTSPTGDAGTLEDQRQQDLGQLSQLVGVSQIQTEDNGLTITTASGALLVSKGQAFKLSTGQVGGSTHIFDASNNDITAELPNGGGQLGGILTVSTQDIPQIQTSLDTLAYAIGSQLNTLNMAGADANGAAGTAIFSLPTSAPGAASQISVVMTDPAKIAAASAGQGPGNNANATAMANLQKTTIVPVGTPPVNQTPTNFYSSFVSALGSLVSNVTTENTAQQSSLSQLQNQRNALSTVNLNEEAASLEDLQKSYEAASKVFTIIDTLMASALDLGVQTAAS